MNTNYKNLYNKYKPNGIENVFPNGEWQHHGVVTEVSLVFSNPRLIITSTNNCQLQEEHDK